MSTGRVPSAPSYPAEPEPRCVSALRATITSRGDADEFQMEANMREAGPNEIELRVVLAEQIAGGLVNMHISWGPEGEAMSPEEKARYIIDHIINRDTSGDVLVSASEFDRQTLAPHVPPAVWGALRPDEKDREVGRMTLDDFRNFLDEPLGDI